MTVSALARMAVAVAAAVTAASGVAGCAGSSTTPGPASSAVVGPSVAASAPAAAPSVEVPRCQPVHLPAWNTANFRDPTHTTNPWIPLVPGTQLTSQGQSIENGRPVAHQIVFTPTDLVKVLDGVVTRVAWEVDTDNGVLAESELVFFAQDNDGNLWTLGEYPEEYRNGKLSGAPRAWAAGVAGAGAGVAVRGTPAVGGGEYLQGISPSVEFLDCAKDVKSNQRVCVPAGCYDNVLVVDERSPEEPDSGVQRKYYASNVGSIRVEAIGDPEGETLALTRVSQPSGTVLDTARAEALRLDQRAGQSSAFRAIPPAHLP